MITVYHAYHDRPGVDINDIRDLYARNPDLVGTIKRVWTADGYVKVATVDTDDINTAYRKTNNISTSWSMDETPGVTVLAPLHIHNGKTYGLQSTSVGDLFEHNGLFYYADGYAFPPMPAENFFE